MNKRNPKATEVNVKKLSKFAHINVPEFKQEIQKVTLTKEKEIPKPKFAFDLEDSSDEETDGNLNTNAIIQNTFKLYKEKVGDENLYVSAEKRIREQIEESAHQRCLICIEKIRGSEGIWECKQCYCIFHLSCIQSWIGNRSVSKANTLSKENFPNRSCPFHCAKCRKEYTDNEYPSDYLCFCGKVKNPEFDAWTTPHSCGNVCGKRLAKSTDSKCNHTCILICHPGKCPDCVVMVESNCYCGKNKTYRRCSNREYECGRVCNKKLQCNKHKCTLNCHEGPCPPCDKESIALCLCKRTETMRPCSQLIYQCNQVCNLPYSCRKHKCAKVCHEGDCGPCPRSLPRQCPCGKSTFTLPCDQAVVPSCGDTCGKLLNCGSHRCHEKCGHSGNCPSCRESVTKICRCGKSKKDDWPCYKEYQCERKCGKMKQCGKHQCKRKCCDGSNISCAVCTELCDKLLPCKNHKCTAPCGHIGSCSPCTVTLINSCACGSTVKQVPCGVKKMAPPKCRSLCRIPNFCHHAERLPHRCHFGSCPPCTQLCNLTNPHCNHICVLPCHDPIPPFKFQEHKLNKKAKVLVFPQPISNIDAQLKCPPCPVIVQRQCVGLHEEVSVVCSQPPVFSCARNCGNLLNCGNHSCTLQCHTVGVPRLLATNDNGNQKVVLDKSRITGPLDGFSDNCKPCNLICKKPRNPPCFHPCKLPCHLNSCPNCEELIKFSCFCSKIKVYVKCFDTHNVELMRQLRSCKSQCEAQLPYCSHLCTKICHDGNVPHTEQCDQKTSVTCKCKRIKDTWLCQKAQEKRSSLGTDKYDKLLLDCDEECEKIKLAKLASYQQKKESENKTEAASSSSSTFVKKYKQKKRKEIQEEVKPNNNKLIIILSIVIPVLLAILAYLFMNSNKLSI